VLLFKVFVVKLYGFLGLCNKVIPFFVSKQTFLKKFSDKFKKNSYQQK